MEPLEVLELLEILGFLTTSRSLEREACQLTRAGMVRGSASDYSRPESSMSRSVATAVAVNVPERLEEAGGIGRGGSGDSDAWTGTGVVGPSRRPSLLSVLEAREEAAV